MLILKEDQNEHFNKLKEIVDKYNFYIDKSQTGTGKTYLSIMLSLREKLTLFVISSVTVIANWKTIADLYGISHNHFYTKNWMITMHKGQLKNGYVEIEEFKIIRNGREEKYRNVRITNKFKELCKTGILFIVDEFQYIKNMGTLTSQVIGEMIKYIINDQPEPISKVGLLSASPFDKREHIVRFFKTIGAFLSYKPEGGRFDREGYQITNTGPAGVREALRDVTIPFLVNKLHFRESEAINIIENYITKYDSDASEILYYLYVKHVKPLVSHSMLLNIKYNLDIQNLFCDMTVEESKNYADAIRILEETLKDNKEKGERIVKKVFDSSGLVEVQKAKVNIVVRLAKWVLDNPKFIVNGVEVRPKVIIYASYIRDVIDKIQAELEYYNPLVLTGDTTQKDRSNIIRNFNKPDDEYRLVIGNTVVGATGISLHDTHGGFTRIMFIIPDFSVNNLHQATNRIYRVGVIGDQFVRIIYGKGSVEIEGKKALESNIWEILKRKGVLMEQVAAEQMLAGVTFPSKYDIELEENSLFKQQFEEEDVIATTSKMFMGQIENEIQLLKSDKEKQERELRE